MASPTHKFEFLPPDEEVSEGAAHCRVARFFERMYSRLDCLKDVAEIFDALHDGTLYAQLGGTPAVRCNAIEIGEDHISVRLVLCSAHAWVDLTSDDRLIARIPLGEFATSGDAAPTPAAAVKLPPCGSGRFLADESEMRQ